MPHRVLAGVPVTTKLPGCEMSAVVQSQLPRAARPPHQIELSVSPGGAANW